MTDLELDDIQGLIVRAYADLKAAAYVLLQVDDAAAARGWLQEVVSQVTPAPAHPSNTAINVAFTFSGIQKLGLGEDALAQFPNEFSAGMTTPHRRRMFGDVGSSAPERWAWGGPSTPTPDALLLVFARDVPTLQQRCSELQAAFRGLSEIIRLESVVDLDGKEHFGFAEGISQPTIEGLSSRKDI